MTADPETRTEDRIPREVTGIVQVSHGSHDGAISVVVSLDGAVVDLRLAEVATQRPAAQLARDILECIHEAQHLFGPSEGA